MDVVRGVFFTQGAPRLMVDGWQDSIFVISLWMMHDIQLHHNGMLILNGSATGNIRGHNDRKMDEHRVRVSPESVV